MNKSLKVKTSDRNYWLSASLICADVNNLADDVRILELSGIDFLHIDVMDGMFVPRFGMFPEQVAGIRKISSLPMDLHLMVENPEPYFETFRDAGVDYISVHVEVCRHLNRTVSLIKKLGCKAGLAINPATPIEFLPYVLDDIKMINLMGINPGIVGHKLIGFTYEKIRRLKSIVGERDIFIEIDGGVTTESASEMIQAGANMLVCGSSTVFRKEMSITKAIESLRVNIEKSIK